MQSYDIDIGHRIRIDKHSTTSWVQDRWITWELIVNLITLENNRYFPICWVSYLTTKQQLWLNFDLQTYKHCAQYIIYAVLSKNLGSYINKRKFSDITSKHIPFFSLLRWCMIEYLTTSSKMIISSKSFFSVCLR